jgi:cbb3-type cytochrome oxidase subunit 3
MISQVLSHYHLPMLACAGLLLFLAVFLGAGLWVFRKGSGEVYRETQNLPFDERAVK